MKDKLILITGATSGIGLAAARELARMGGRLILHGRSQAKLEAARQSVLSTAPDARVDTIMADMSSLAQVRTMALELIARYPHLDVLINNAGLIASPRRQESRDGIELTLAVNYLAPFLLTELLLPLLIAAPAARVINTASGIYKAAMPDFGNLQYHHGYGPVMAYASSKLFNILFTQELARHMVVKHPTITTYALHPGVVKTGFSATSGGMMSTMFSLMRPFLLTPERGAETSIYLAARPGIEDQSGEYFEKRLARPVKHPYATPQRGRQLWELTEQMIAAYRPRGEVRR